MSLADFQPAWAVIDYKGRPLTKVRGLNLIDLSSLVEHHLVAMETAYAKLVADGVVGKDFASVDADKATTSVVLKAPGLAAAIIGYASDEDTDAATSAAKLLPAPLQIKILIAVMRLTFEDVGGPLAFVALLTDLRRNATLEHAGENRSLS